MRSLIFIIGLSLASYNKTISYHEQEVVFPRDYVQNFSEYFAGRNLEYVEISRVDLVSNSIILQNVKEWIGNEPGDFTRVIVEKKNGGSFKFENTEAWVTVADEFRKYTTNPYFLQLNIGAQEPVLIFFGYTYASNPGWLTIISLQGPKPEIIFNKEIELIKIVKNGDGYKLIVDRNFWERGDDNGETNRLRKSANAYKSCKEVYIENNEVKVVPCTRTLKDDAIEKSNQAKQKEKKIDFTEIDNISIKDSTIRLSQVTEYIKYHEKGDFTKLEIIKNNELKLELNEHDGWVKIQDKFRRHTNNPYFFLLDIGAAEPVLILLKSYSKCTHSGGLTIISLQEDKPKVIFDKQYCNLVNIFKSGNHYKLIVSGSPSTYSDSNPYLYCEELYIENNKVKTERCTRTIEDDEREAAAEKAK